MALKISLLLLQSALSFYVEPSPHNEHVIERSTVSINNVDNLEKASSFSNVRKIGDEVALRSSDGKGSLINLNEQIASDNWSVEFMVKNLVLKDVEKAGMYLWYTEKKLEGGSYKGGNPVFNGFVLGVEFSQDKAELAFSFNYGLDFSRKDIQSTRYDCINPSLIDHLDQFRVKIIHTEKNFKIEVFDDSGTLVSDSFRIHEPLIMNKGSSKNFAITTAYENAPSDVYLTLKDLKIYTREETEKYDYRDLYTEHNSFPRNKSDEELRMAVADIDHFLNYVTVVLGSGKQNNIVQMALEVKKRARLVKDSLDSMISAAKEASKLSFHALETERSIKAEELARSLNDALLKAEKYRQKLKEIGSRRRPSLKASNIVLVFGMIFLMATAARTVAGKILGRVKGSKKE